MLKSILVAFVLSILALVSGLSGCDASDSSSFTTIESTDCSGALCLTADMTDTSGFCTGKVSLVDQNNGVKYSAELPGYPVLSFPTFDYAERPLFNMVINAPCADINIEKMVFDVNLGSSAELSVFEMYYNGKKVEKVSGYVSGDVSMKNEMIIEWASDGLLISKSFDNNGSFALACLGCESFPKKAEVTVCLRSVWWKIMLYDGHDSSTYVMGTPDVCQTTQF